MRPGTDEAFRPDFDFGYPLQPSNPLAPKMPDAFSMVTGVISIASGVAGAVMGYIAFRRTGQYKALDLRVQLRKEEGDLRAQIERLPSLLDKAEGSRRAIFAANGQRGSGAEVAWVAELNTDRGTVGVLRDAWLRPPPEYSKLSNEDLETRIVEVHRAADESGVLREKYLAALAADDREREDRRRTMNQPR